MVSWVTLINCSHRRHLSFNLLTTENYASLGAIRKYCLIHEGVSGNIIDNLSQTNTNRRESFILKPSKIYTYHGYYRI